LKLEEKLREDSGTPLLLTRIFHNKAVDYGQYVIDTYFTYINYDFLFGKGGEPARDRTPNAGLFYPIELLFFIIGIYYVAAKKVPWGFPVLVWFFMAPLLLSFALDETPNMHRFLLALLPFELITAFGIYSFYTKIKKRPSIKKIYFLIVPTIFALNLAFYMHQLFIHQPVHRPWFRGFAYKELIAALNSYYPSYKKIVMTKSQSSPYIYILFYNKFNPEKYQSEGSPRDLDYTGFDKYYFVPSDCPLKEESDGNVTGEEGVIYINKGSCLTPERNARELVTIYWRDNSAAFKIVEFVSSESAVIKRPTP
jgi:hypothetical protein